MDFVTVVASIQLIALVFIMTGVQRIASALERKP
jgi:hypothetical protein